MLTRVFGFLLLAVFAVSRPLHADVLLGIRDADTTGSSTVSGFVVRFDAPALGPVFSGADKAPMPAVVAVDSVALTVRKHKPGGKGRLSTTPLRLKVYADASRTCFLGESVEAHGWNVDTGSVATDTVQLYHFSNLRLRTDVSYAFILESESGPAKAVGIGGFKSIMPSPVDSAVLLKPTLKEGPQRSVPVFQFKLKSTTGEATKGVVVAPAPLSQATAEPVLAASGPQYYQLRLGHFSPERWAATKSAFQAVPGVTRVSGKRTGEVLIVCDASTGPLTKEALERALKPVSGVTIADFKTAESDAF